MLSDRKDRRVVLIGTAVVALAADLVFVFGGLTEPIFLMANVAVFGAAVFAMYPVIVAHANDHAAEGSFIQISGGLLMIYGIGAIIGPAVAGLLMASFGPESLFMTTAGAHILLLLFAVIRLRARASVPVQDKGTFQAAPFARASTPETAALATGPSDSDVAEN
jgi:MFS family permease